MRPLDMGTGRWKERERGRERWIGREVRWSMTGGGGVGRKVEREGGREGGREGCKIGERLSWYY